MLLNFDPLKISIDAIAMLFILISEYFLSFILYLEMLFLSWPQFFSSGQWRALPHFFLIRSRAKIDSGDIPNLVSEHLVTGDELMTYLGCPQGWKRLLHEFIYPEPPYLDWDIRHLFNDAILTEVLTVYSTVQVIFLLL